MIDSAVINLDSNFDSSSIDSSPNEDVVWLLEIASLFSSFGKCNVIEDAVDEEEDEDVSDDNRDEDEVDNK